MTAAARLPAWLRPAVAETTSQATQIIRVAWLGRTSDEEQQDPTLSLPRQLDNCEHALLPRMRIVARFYDVETSRKELAQRGDSRAWTKFDIPIRRDGGIADLLAEALAPDRRFDVVICESVDRIARYTYQGTKIEHDLELAGIPLLASDEPIILDRQDGRRRKRASQILLRRTKQGVAEWYIVEMLEKSWDGFAIHTAQGWNVGKPPYGYLAERHKHPVPAKRAEGKHKTKLKIDPVRGPVVEHVYALRVDEKLAYRAIAERLNADLDRYPPPQPVDSERAVGRWTGSAIREILINPKYTGHMVWNRRSTKDKLHPGKNNSREEWVVSEADTHPSIVTIDLFVAAQNVSGHRRRSRSDANAVAPNRHPQTKTTYLLRSYVSCELCEGRRMHGKRNHARTPYYCCQPRERKRPDGHPATIWLREDELLDGLTAFFNQRILGPDRITLASRSIDTAAVHAAEEHQQRTRAACRAIDDVKQRLDRLTTILEERDDPDGTVFARIQSRLIELETQLLEREIALARLETEAPLVAPGSIDLLEHLPEVQLDLTALPADHLQRLLSAFAVQISYDRRTHTATYRARISGLLIPQVSQLVGAIASTNVTGRRTHRASDPSSTTASGSGKANRRSLHSSMTRPAGGTEQVGGRTLPCEVTSAASLPR
ncbi:MAG: recombinase family protein [Dactylosporangium sp.]|nr:recombinase family protein [Dactylosporangium sp.]NNJ63226.1 recombinase family protein [Dactylosporangium sp.]